MRFPLLLQPQQPQERQPHHRTNYIKPNVNIVSSLDHRIPCLGSRNSKEKMSRSKSSIIRSSSTGSYPYPRTHTTLMVIPSNRPPAAPQNQTSVNKIFTGVRRRPPLNRACPPIPESKSNESIMSHASKVSEKQQKASAETTVEDLVIENRNVVDMYHRLDSNSNIAAKPCKKEEKEKNRRSKKMSTSSSTPRSPLMNVAHSVKNKLTKITHIGRSSDGSPSSSSIKQSQSFSGIRLPKAVPKRIDQNANRVIKSSSMDVSQPSTSKVTIPQNIAPLTDHKIEEISEAGLIPKSEIAQTVSLSTEKSEEEKIMEDNQRVIMKLEEDVLVVTKEFDEKYPGQKRSASPDPPARVITATTEVREPEMVEVITKEEIETFDANANPKTPGVTRRMITTTTTTITTTHAEELEHKPEPIDHHVVVDEVIAEERDSEVVRVEDGESREPLESETRVHHSERMTSPERYVMIVKTPEALKEHRTLVVEPKEDNAADDTKVVQEHEPRKMKKSKSRNSSQSPEQMVSPERYVLVVKTPEALRKHRTLTIGQKDPMVSEALAEAQVGTEKEEKIQYTQLETVKFAMIETPPQEKFILTVKTPEALRRHHTFTIRDKSPEEIREQQEKLIKITKSKSDVHVSKLAKGKLQKQKSEPERMISPERYVLVVRTPEALRKHRTLTIGNRDSSVDNVEPEVKVQKVETLEKLAVKKMRRSESEVRERKIPEDGGNKYVMIMKTPEALRRHHTFTIGPRPKSPDYPYIEEGEITEPIATVGPPAERRKKEEKKEKKRKEWEEYEKPKEKYVMTTTTPIAMRKYQTFMVEPKATEEPIPTSTSADAVTTSKKGKGKIQRSESTDSKKHSYLRRLQFELFRGRSRERKNEKQEKRQKSLDERKPESAQKYVLSTSTPIMMRKYQTFAIVDGNKQKETVPDNNLESIAASYRREKSFDDGQFESYPSTSPIRTSDFYSITATTPVAKRKNLITSESGTSSSGKQISFEPVSSHHESTEHHPSQISPEPRLLFVMGGRKSTTPKEERKSRIEEPPRHLKLEMDKNSQSDHAERKSTLSGDLTSPEEEIPMDTNLTPTTDDVLEGEIISRRIEGLMASPIEEEPEGLTSSIRDVSIRSEKIHLPVQKIEEGYVQRAAPVFTPPSPPPVLTLPKSTSTSSSDSNSASRKPTQLPLKKTIEIDPMHIVELKPSTNPHKPSKTGKSSQIGAKSLRNAGKMLTPSFLRKDRKGGDDKKLKKGYVKTTSMGREHVTEKLERKAPLAERESTQIANSPLVENLPITFEKWSTKSPRQGVKRFSETIQEEAGLDTNANLNFSQLETTIPGQIPTSHLHHNQHQDTGLIDDDILDQPMLVGDTFSHSSSIDCISQHLQQSKMTESIISIDRSMAIHDSRNSGTPGHHSENHGVNHQNPNLTKQIDAGLIEVEDIKNQLQRLNKIVNEIGVSGWEEELIRLRRENAELRNELAERDATIAALRSQTVST